MFSLKFDLIFFFENQNFKLFFLGKSKFETWML